MIAIDITTRTHLLCSVFSREKENFSQGYINFKKCHCKTKIIAWYSSDSCLTSKNNDPQLVQCKHMLCGAHFHNLPGHFDQQNSDYCTRGYIWWTLGDYTVSSHSAQTPVAELQNKLENISFFKVWCFCVGFLKFFWSKGEDKYINSSRQSPDLLEH